MTLIVSEEMIDQRIFFLRGMKVMLSTHLAQLYEVEARALIQAVKRNTDRFPPDFMFQLTWEEVKCLRSQSGVGLINSVDDFPITSDLWPHPNECCSPKN